VHALKARAGNRRPSGPAAGGEQQRVVGEPLSIIEPHLPGTPIDLEHASPQPQVDAVIGIELQRTNQQTLFLQSAPEVLLR
jgi:hypothetical protein